MSIEERILTDALGQLLGVIQSLEQFIDWRQAGQDRKDDFDIALLEAKEALGDPGCEGEACVRR